MGTDGWETDRSTSPQSGPSRQQATPKAMRARPARPNTRSMVSNRTRHTTSHTARAVNGIHRR